MDDLGDERAFIECIHKLPKSFLQPFQGCLTGWDRSTIVKQRLVRRHRMSDEIFQQVKNGEPPGLYFGDVKLNNGSTVKGVLFPKETAESNYKDISNFGDWRAYIASLKK